MTCAAEAMIDLQALQYNLQRVRDTATTSRIISVIKANGYGHGMLRVAHALKESDAFAVAKIDEAMALREAGISQSILLLEGFADSAELLLIAQHKFDIVVHHTSQIELLEQVMPSPLNPIRVWLKIDTGMHRLGIALDEAITSFQRLQACANVAGEVVVMSHFANADDQNDPRTNTQLKRFQNVVATMDANSSLANSAAILAYPQSHGEWVRPGIMLYGVSPFIDGTAADDGLKPVMTLSSKLIAINHYKKGNALGYGGSWHCPEDMPVGVVAIGYGDGYPRAAIAGTPVLINGQRVPLIARVSMDMICVDLRTQPAAVIGDRAVLWGEGLPVEEIAQNANTIPYELLCRVSQRVNFVERK